jgi:uncharacterized protein YndB with AHSA1/START domain
MAVEKDGSGRRSVSAEVEVPGTPEEVWEAIATGPGISAWFVPAEVDGGVGGKTICHFGPDDSMDAVAEITEWEAPHRFVAQSEEEGPGIVATEWLVEAKGSGTCVVRVMHSWAAEGDDWDAEFEGHAGGWLSFFKILRLYLEHFAGQPSTLVQVAAQSDGSQDEVWERLAGPLGLLDVEEGQRISSSEEAPAFEGIVHEAEYTPEGCSAIVRLQQPVPALAHVMGFPMGGPIYLSVRFYLYGEDAANEAGSLESRWQEWLAERFPMAEVGA